MNDEQRAKAMNEAYMDTIKEQLPKNIKMLHLAKAFAGLFSKDPTTKVGAVITRPDFTIAGMGYNGFPRNFPDDARLDDREFRHKMTVHAEINAILDNRDPSIRGYSLHTYPQPPCIKCVPQIIQSGIKKVYSYEVPKTDKNFVAYQEASALLGEAGITVVLLPSE